MNSWDELDDMVVKVYTDPMQVAALRPQSLYFLRFFGAKVPSVSGAVKPSLKSAGQVAVMMPFKSRRSIAAANAKVMYWEGMSIINATKSKLGMMAPSGKSSILRMGKRQARNVVLDLKSVADELDNHFGSYKTALRGFKRNKEASLLASKFLGLKRKIMGLARTAVRVVRR